MSGIFISYRRRDSAGHTGRLADDLGQQLDHQALFRDVEAIEPGVDFVDALERAVSACSVMLVIIGPMWSSAATADGKQRLFQANDFVRMEVEAALARGIRVIPVLVGDAQMPEAEDIPESMAPLLRRHAFSISDRRWQYDVSQLVDILVRIPGVAVRQTPTPAVPTQNQARMSGGLMAFLAATALMVALALLVILGSVDEEEPALATAPVATAVPAPESATSTTATDQAEDAARFYGNWVSANGEVFNIDTEEDTGKLYVFAGSRIDDGTGGGTDTPPPSAPGQDLYGNGSIDGDRLTVTLYDLYSNQDYSLVLEISEDASTLTGSISKGENMEPRELSLRLR